MSGEDPRHKNQYLVFAAERSSGVRSNVLPVSATCASVSVPQLIESSLYYRWLDSEQDAWKIPFARRHAAGHVDERKGADQLAAGKNKKSGGGRGFAEVTPARLGAGRVEIGTAGRKVTECEHMSKPSGTDECDTAYSSGP